MAFPLPPGSLSFADTIAKYFNPARSPFYGIIAFGVFAYCFSSKKGIGDYGYWSTVTIIFVVLAFSLWRSLGDKSVFTPEEYGDQMKFARSLSVGAATMCLAWLNYGEHGFDQKQTVPRIIIASVICSIQICVFLAYIWTRQEAGGEDRPKVNLIQLSLITTTFLVGASYLIFENDGTFYDEKSKTVVAKNLLPYLTSDLMHVLPLLFLWAICIYYWCKYLISMFSLKPQSV